MNVDTATPIWLLLVVSLPTASATARMRIWRALKSQGCEALRDGAYLMPAGGERADALQELAQECTREGGTAWLMAVQPRWPSEDEAWQVLFDRSEAYAGLRKTWKETAATLANLSPQELTRLQRRLSREYEAVRVIDFFPADAATETQAAWAELERRIQRVLAPDEPHETAGAIPRLDAGAYRGRTWATRRRLWVDRVASAWLIRRFIDPAARFLWLAQPGDCPKDALGFDFDGAAFTHVGERVSFETLLASFGLEDDAALVRLAAMVHQLDVGGEPVPEAVGFEAVMAGARERLDDDDALLAEIGTVLDSLYAHFKRAAVKEK
ncbi:chromate resistance protein ChrB domain-containing protein [Azohydromonas lata]|uniref:Chromate resistance protein n=1 Tax=Azohydromonas lata TaxID=45677 RepID=A0ABU5I945_9BURK|nr:chromate resistance protein ChrB domain-containing protein [Azohydromonas lata]MDZ5455624.1 chromate resistance protein [Azohydromonas lata]